MEEEESSDCKEISRKDYGKQGEDANMNDRKGDSIDADKVASDSVLQRVASATIVTNDELSEHVSLNNEGKTGKEMNQSLNPEVLRHSSIESETTYEFSFPGVRSSGFVSPLDLEARHDHDYACPGPEIGPNYYIRESSSSPGLDNYLQFYGDSRYPSFDSPWKSKAEEVMPNVSTELLHSVDSAILGKADSLEKLKNVVSGVDSFGGDDDAVANAYLIVDSLLATMGGVESFEEEDNSPSVMLNSRAAIVSGELIPWLPDIGDFGGLMSPRTRMVKGLLAILRGCTRNRAMCSMAGLLGVLLHSAERIFVQDINSVEKIEWDGTPLCHCIQYLAGHSLSPHDLHQWLQVVNRTLTTAWATRLLNSMESAMTGQEVTGPASTFELDGESSGMLGPGESTWPFTNGFGFATWIYIESFANNISEATTAEIGMAAAATSGKSSPMSAAATSGKASPMSAAAAATALAGEGTEHMPRLFSFLSADNQGIEAYFHAHFLVVECGSGKGRKAFLHFTHAFKPQCWYSIGLEHTCKQGLLGKSESEMRLYIDGSLYETHPFDFPRISKPLAFCCLGTNPPPTIGGLQYPRRQSPLFAEMGPVYIFKEPIGPERMARLVYRGGDVLPSFGSAAGSPWLSTSDHVQSMAQDSSLLDAEIAECIHLLYHPSLLSGRYCPDASPSGAAGILRRPAEILGQVHVASRMRPAEAFWALAHGGPIFLLPLVVSSMHENSLEPQQSSLSLSVATAALAAPIFRIISLAIRHPGNNEEVCRRRAPEILSRILNYILQTFTLLDVETMHLDEELVAAIVSICQSQRFNHKLKVNLFSALLLDLKIWSLCSYGLQKKLLSSLADMVFSESLVMRDADAIQMLLDGCRRCYWTVRETDSVNTFSLSKGVRLVGEVNALVDELLVVIELLVLAAPPSLAAPDIRCLLGFMIDCPQPNQVARVLYLIYRLAVQPNTSRAQIFAEAFISCDGVETVLVLLQRETKAGDHNIPELLTYHDEKLSSVKTDVDNTEGSSAKTGHVDVGSEERRHLSHENVAEHENIGGPTVSKIDSKPSISGNNSPRNFGGISCTISAENARKNTYNVESTDDVIVGIINLVSALVISGHLKFVPPTPQDVKNNLVGLLEGGGTMFHDKVSLLLFGLQKAFQAAPNRLMTHRACMALLAASLNKSSSDDGLNFHDSGHRFEHLQILLILLRSLPYAPMPLQSRALQDLLILACSHEENRNSLTSMDAWPEWILEILISNYERHGSKSSYLSSLKDVEDFIHNFFIIILEHSMRQKDGWQDIEATIHCAEWLCMVGGSSTGNFRIRREEALPIFKRRLLGGLLDFATRELQAQIQVIAAAAAGVAAEGLSPKTAKIEAENASQLSMALVENAVVILMLVEDHFRLQSKLYSSSRPPTVTASPFSNFLPLGDRSSTTARGETKSSRNSSSSDSGGLSLSVLASMADPNGQISATVMERLTAAAAAEPYESVSCAFASYGSCVRDLSEGWKYRSRLWYGVGLPSEPSKFGGGGNGWESWKIVLEKDANGNWIELPLIRKSVAMLHALLMDESGLGGSLSIGAGSGTGMGAMSALYQLLDSDQPFLCMLRIVLVSLREDDHGEDHMPMTRLGTDDGWKEGFHLQTSSTVPFDTSNSMPTSKPLSALLWSVLSPLLNMPISEKKRQRVLVSSSILYSEVWHAIGSDRTPLRKQYLEIILPPFVAVLRRWRPLLSGIQQLATADGTNPFVADDSALAADALPVEAALVMTSPSWAAFFASPPAAMALAMMAAGAGGGETTAPRTTTSQLRRDTSLVVERKTTKFQPFKSFHKPSESTGKFSNIPKDKASAKAAALAAARDLERNARIGSGRGLSAVAMATSAQRRSKRDNERVKRWKVSEAMGTAWRECQQSVDSKSVYGKDFNALSYKYIAVLVGSLALARNMKRSEVDRRVQAHVISQHQLYTGKHEWRKLIHCLIEMKCLFGPSADALCNPKRVFWKLDFMESSSRMRRILRRNYQGSDHLGSAAKYEDHIHGKVDNHKAISPSKASIVPAEAISTEVEFEDEPDMAYPNASPNVEHPSESQSISSKSSEQPLMLAESMDAPLTRDPESAPIPEAVAPGYVPSEDDESIIFELPSSMVSLLKVLKGIFQVTTRRINFIIDHMNNNGKENVEGNGFIDVREKDQSWVLSSLRKVYSRRYLLRRSALEVFMVDRSNFFFDFGSTEGRRNAYRAIVQACPPHLNNIYLATQNPEQLLKRTQLMSRWARWEISNFEYLMQLNTLAGRSYNDITQYPVFPWILSDYCSQNLDLSSPSSFRDLSKPIGALNPERLKKFQERYSSFDDPVIPKFHYGSHYSTAGIVLYYLTRAEPFTSLSVQLQGGQFDHADRMLSDIGATWNGVLEDMSDVKELVPELFYLPEVLTDENSIDFGTTQFGEKLDSVRLPPWAESPVDFVHKHQRALESEHVSKHLHEWIDLIFGYKQRGEEAVLANNVFFYTTYEGAVDIDKISDPVQQRGTQDQIAYLGLTPSQLLTVPHMKRMSLIEVLHTQTIFRNPTELKPYMVPSPEHCNLPAAAIHASDDGLIIVGINAPAAHVAQYKWQPNTPDGQGLPFLFHHGKPDVGAGGGSFMRMFKGPTPSESEKRNFPRAVAFTTSGIRSTRVVSITCDKEIITGGHVDNSVRLVSPAGAKTLEIGRGHCAPVTCLSISSDSSYLVTGSQDATVLLWRIHRSSSLHSSSSLEASNNSGTPPSAGSGAAGKRARIEGPIHVLRGHRREITCCAVSLDIGIVASCSDSSDVLLHTIRQGRLIRRLGGVEAHSVCLSSNGMVVTWNKHLCTLSTFTLNGILISMKQLPLSACVSCIEVSADGQRALVGLNPSMENDGGTDRRQLVKTESGHNHELNGELDLPQPSLCFFDLHTLEVIHRLELAEGQDITAIALNKDNTNLLVSTANKELIIFTDPSLSEKS